MASRWCHSLAIALLPGCTGANPAFDAGTGSRGGTEDDGDASKGSPETGSAGTGAASSEGDATDDVIDGTGIDETSEDSDTSDSDPTGGTCSAAPPMKVGEATSLDATRCPSEGVIRGNVFDLNDGSFQIVDCGSCELCPTGAPTWTVTIPAPLAAELLVEGECIDVFYDCDDAMHTELHNLAVLRGSTPRLVIGAPRLPQALGAWEPAAGDREPCPTQTCPENAEMHLEFLDGNLGEGEDGRRRILVDEAEFDLDILVRNAHYDAQSCEPVIVWIGEG